ncbi:hypothetical protein Sjap_008180 [Stephania japonica]|uniref:RNase III domain-containing protein n=1 Tax=Stephania japonica TaxID=461633 RepID=A0AAP0JP07_9MAGN
MTLNHVHMPPELLLRIDVSIGVLRSFYLMPSVMNRLESLMLGSQLKGEISYHAVNSQISSSLILEALTTLRCCESFSLERMELLGDSILKYAVSCYLFLKYPGKPEGQLSKRRKWAICNYALHKLGTNRKIQFFYTLLYSLYNSNCFPVIGHHEDGEEDNQDFFKVGQSTDVRSRDDIVADIIYGGKSLSFRHGRNESDEIVGGHGSIVEDDPIFEDPYELFVMELEM